MAISANASGIVWHDLPESERAVALFPLAVYPKAGAPAESVRVTWGKAC